MNPRVSTTEGVQAARSEADRSIMFERMGKRIRAGLECESRDVAVTGVAGWRSSFWSGGGALTAGEGL